MNSLIGFIIGIVVVSALNYIDDGDYATKTQTIVSDRMR